MDDGGVTALDHILGYMWIHMVYRVRVPESLAANKTIRVVVGRYPATSVFVYLWTLRDTELPDVHFGVNKSSSES